MLVQFSPPEGVVNVYHHLFGAKLAWESHGWSKSMGALKYIYGWGDENLFPLAQKPSPLYIYTHKEPPQDVCHYHREYYVTTKY